MTRRSVCAALASLLLALLPIPVHAGTRSIDLAKRQPDVELVGAYKVAGAGDVNGDSIADLLVAKGDDSMEPSARVVYVVFGRRPMPSRIDLQQLSDYGFAIYGTKPWDAASEVGGAGDINGDGLDDIVIGAPGADNNGRIDSGSVYVVFGKKSTAPVSLAAFDLGTPGLLGYRIDGAYGRSIAGRHVAIIGDINGDEHDDILISAPFAGASYVVFGREIQLPLDLRSFHEGTHGSAGYLIKTPAPAYDELYSVAAAGDVNGDGVPDVLVGVFVRNGDKRGGYVVFGKTTPDAIDVSAMRRGGFRIKGYGATALAGIGDVNDDTLADVAYYNGEPSSYIVFGKRDSRTVDVQELRGQGFEIRGREGWHAGQALAGAGDVNLDGTPDLLLGVPDAGNNNRRDSGSAYVVFGKSSTRSLSLLNLGDRGYGIDGGYPRASLGFSVAGPGDVNGDGRPDLLLGAPGVGNDPGRAFLIWGF